MAHLSDLLLETGHLLIVDLVWTDCPDTAAASSYYPSGTINTTTTSSYRHIVLESVSEGLLACLEADLIRSHDLVELDRLLNTVSYEGVLRGALLTQLDLHWLCAVLLEDFGAGGCALRIEEIYVDWSGPSDHLLVRNLVEMISMESFFPIGVRCRSCNI